MRNGLLIDHRQVPRMDGCYQIILQDSWMETTIRRPIILHPLPHLTASSQMGQVYRRLVKGRVLQAIAIHQSAILLLIHIKYHLLSSHGVAARSYSPQGLVHLATLNHRHQR